MFSAEWGRYDDVSTRFLLITGPRPFAARVQRALLRRIEMPKPGIGLAQGVRRKGERTGAAGYSPLRSTAFARTGDQGRCRLAQVTCVPWCAPPWSTLIHVSVTEADTNNAPSDFRKQLACPPR